MSALTVNTASLGYYCYSKHHLVDTSTKALLFAGLSTGLIGAIWGNAKSTVTAIHLEKQGKQIHLHTASLFGVKKHAETLENACKNGYFAGKFDEN